VWSQKASLVRHRERHSQWTFWANGRRNSYKGMAQSSSGSAAQKITPQATGGFSQIHSRGGGEGGGQAMSVLLSWHEKVCLIRLLPLHLPTFPARTFRNSTISEASCHVTCSADADPARRDRRPWLHYEGNDGPPYSLRKPNTHQNCISKLQGNQVR
jgi:hypothetical protein